MAHQVERASTVQTTVDAAEDVDDDCGPIPIAKLEVRSFLSFFFVFQKF